MKKLNLTLRNYVFKVVIGLIIVLLTTVNLSIIGFSEENTFGKIPVKGLVSEEGLPSYTDEEFQKAPIRINVFSATWCPHCKELKQEFPKEIYSKYKKDTVAIRVWEIDSKDVVGYFQKFADKNEIPQEIKSQIPFIFINEQYPYLGYSKEITNNIIEDIEAILGGKEPKNGGNINLNSNTNKKDSEEPLQYKIEKNLAAGSIKEVEIIQAGMGDISKTIFLSIFPIVCIFLIKTSKIKKGLICAVYAISILICNILILTSIIPIILNTKYVEAIKIGLYILYVIIIEEFIVKFVITNKDDDKSMIIRKAISIFNSKFMIIFSFIIGFFVMNSQIYNKNTNIATILISLLKNQGILDRISIGFFYSLGLILANFILICIIRLVLSILKVLKCNFKIKKYI